VSAFQSTSFGKQPGNLAAQNKENKKPGTVEASREHPQPVLADAFRRKAPTDFA